MAKSGLVPDNFRGQLKGIAAKNGWALCVGAGVSQGAFPNWRGLCEDLVKREDPTRSDADSKMLLTNLSCMYSLDAIIEASRDRLKQTQSEFCRTLSTILYSSLRSKIKKKDWRVVTEALSAGSPGDMKSVVKWNQFLDIIRTNFAGITSLAIAEAVVDSLEANIHPSAIISFNAEPLLYALINANCVARFKPTPATSFPKRVLDRITRQTSYREAGRIPYFYCHGLLPFSGCSPAFKEQSDTEKLIFSEGEYLSLANTSFAWQSSVFLSAGLFRSFRFVGLSLSDPNMRRWLSWIQFDRMHELHKRCKDIKSTQHFWLEKIPDKSAPAGQKEWMESLVAHLGIRIIWLNDWSDAGSTLKNALT